MRVSLLRGQWLIENSRKKLRLFCKIIAKTLEKSAQQRYNLLMKKNKTITPNTKKRKKRLIIAGIVFIIVILLYVWGFWLKTDTYDIKSDKINDKLKIVFISDLHNCFFGGTDQSAIEKEIEKAKPDIVIFGGDTLDMVGGEKHALTLMKWSAERYPCYYVPGNHEGMRDDIESFYQKVKDTGVKMPMDSEFFQLEIRGQKIRIYGVAQCSYYGQMSKLCGIPDNEYYNILVAHQPEQINKYLDTGDSRFDLILSGHAHAGQWRIPGILDQGLYAPDQGLFPDYTNGMYQYDDTVHIISRGLAKPLRMIFIPRIFNRPELSVIEVS